MKGNKTVTKSVYCYNCNNRCSVSTEGFLWEKVCDYCKKSGTLRNKKSWGEFK